MLALSMPAVLQVCAFDLVNFCQEQLRQQNQPAKNVPASLWHDMQQRDSVLLEEDALGGAAIREALDQQGFWQSTGALQHLSSRPRL